MPWPTHHTSIRLGGNSAVTLPTTTFFLKCDRGGVLRSLMLFVLLAASAAGTQTPTTSNKPRSAPHDPQTDAAFDDFYNMQYDRATQAFEKILEKHPNDAFAVNHLLTTILMRDLYDTGAMNTRDYANDSFIGRAPRPTDQKIKDRIKELARRAEELEEKQLKANSKDAD